MSQPITYPGAKTFLSAGVETVQGTAVPPTCTYPLESFDPQDMPTPLDDTSLTGDMAELNGVQFGGIHSEFSFAGPYFGDFGPMMFHNILGDLSDDGLYTGSGTTTLSNSPAAGALAIQTALTIAPGTVIAISAGLAKSEVRTVTTVTGAGPFTVNFAQPLSFAHTTGEIVRPVGAPYAHAESLLNSGTAQPPSLTFIDWQGLTATVGARAYTGCCLSELTLKGNAESEYISMSGKGLGWKSAAAAAAPVSAATTAVPFASWRSLLGLAGPASGGTQVKTVSQWEITITRKLKAYFTAQGSQNPYIIQRGGVRITGKLEIPVPSDETHLNYLLQNTQPQFQWVVSNGLAGAALLSLQVDIAKAAYKTAKAQKAEAMGYSVTFAAVKSATNAGASGGTSPIKVTTQNAVIGQYGY